MPSSFDIGGAVNGAADWACNAPIIRGIVGNPIFTALLITALAAIIAMAIFRRQVSRASGTSIARALIYLFLSATAVLFVHHYAVTRSSSDCAQQQNMRHVFSSIKESQAFGTGAGAGLGVGAAALAYPSAAPAYLAADGSAIVGAPPAGAIQGGAADAPLRIEDVVLPVGARPFTALE